MSARTMDTGLRLAVPPSDIERTLCELVSSRNIRLSERNRKFLDFVVRETIAGRGERIKAYTIGVDVFGRGPEFDPNTDPIVRIEATRLRAALQEYYCGSGNADTVRITIPRGSYMPTFERGLAAPGPGAAPSRPAEGEAGAAAIIVAHLTDPRDKSGLARGGLLVNALVGRLIAEQFRVFVVPLQQQRAAMRRMEDWVDACHGALMLEIVVHQLAEGRRYSWSVSDFHTGELRGHGDIDLPEETPPSAATIAMLTQTAYGALSVAVAQGVPLGHL